MAGQEHIQRRREPDPQPPSAPAAAIRATEKVRDEETDALLDEIDGVLETNAQDFVHSFVQKGGE